MLIWYLKQKQKEYLRQKSEDSNIVTITPPSTPDYHQLEQPLIPPFQSRLISDKYNFVMFFMY